MDPVWQKITETKRTNKKQSHGLTVQKWYTKCFGQLARFYCVNGYSVYIFFFTKKKELHACLYMIYSISFRFAQIHTSRVLVVTESPTFCRITRSPRTVIVCMTFPEHQGTLITRCLSIVSIGNFQKRKQKKKQDDSNHF